MTSQSTSERLSDALVSAQRFAVGLLAVVMTAGGLLILVYGGSGNPTLSALGSTLLATGTLAIGWELFVRRQGSRVQRQEIEKAVSSRWSEPVEGLIRVGLAAFKIDDLERALASCDNFRATCLYDHHWSEPQWSEPLARYFRRRSTRAEFILPNPSDENLMTVLALRHQLTDESGRTPGQRMEHRVRELASQLVDLARDRPSSLTLLYVDGWGPSYTAYLFSKRRGEGFGMMRQFGHSMGTGKPLPETVFSQGGALWVHAWGDFDVLHGRAHA